METPVIDFWFEVFMTHSDESTETVHSTGNIKEAIKYAKENNLKVDLWIVDQMVKSLPVPTMEIKEETTFEEIKNYLLDCEDISTDGMKVVTEGLYHQLR